MMEISFKNPAEFLRYIQRSLGDKPPETDHPAEYLKVMKTRALKLAEENPEMSSLIDDALLGKDMIIAGLSNRVLVSLDTEVRERIEAEVAIGSVESPDVGAWTFRSPGDQYAIVVSRGLYFVLNAVLKLSTADKNPASVVHWEGLDLENLTPEYIESFAKSFLNEYRKTGETTPAPLLLDPSANLSSGIMMDSAEIFILCHEIGHFLNGDLDDENLFAGVKTVPGIYRFEENKNHTVEYAADETGYELYLKVTKERFAKLPDFHPLLPVSLIFDLFYLIGEEGSESHPPPIRRTLRLATKFYGSDFARNFEETYHTPSLLSRLIKKSAASKIVPYKEI